MKFSSIFRLRKWVGLFLSTKCGKRLDDRKFICLEFYAHMGKLLNLKNPVTFNEKLQWLKLYDRNPMYTRMVDKLSAKEYVADIIGEQYIIPTLGVWDKPEDIDFDVLPDQFVLKVTHDSGGVIVCKNRAEFSREETIEKLNRSLRREYYLIHREWPYKNIRPRIIAEQYMEDDIEHELRDYKFMCFHGEVKCSFVCTNRFSDAGLHVTFFDRNWDKMPFERQYPASSTDIKRPKNYQKMIYIAEELTKGIPFARVDLYEVNNKIYFGEITFYPGSGYEAFSPEVWDQKLGEWILLKMDEV